MATAVNSAANVVVQLPYVYWSSGGTAGLLPPMDGSLWRVDIESSAPPEALLPQMQASTDFVVVGDAVYWISVGSLAGDFLDGFAKSYSLAAGTIEIVADGLAFPLYMKTDGVALYCLGKGTYTGSNYYNGNLIRLSLDGTGGREELLVDQDRPIALDVDETHVYWASERAMTVWRMPKEGGPVSVLFEPTDYGPVAIGGDQEAIYVLDNAGRVFRLVK